MEFYIEKYFVTLFYIFIFFLLFPLSVSAQLVITEISYNPEGADTDKEWIEVINTGDSSIDLTKYRLIISNKGTKHHIREGIGGTIIDANEVVVLAKNPSFISSVLREYSYDGDIFKSSFSLPNTTAIVSIYDVGLDKDIATAEYNSENGDGKDGNTVHFNSDGTFIYGTPSPGRVDIDVAPTTESKPTQTNPVVNSSSTGEKRKFSYSRISVKPRREYLTNIPLEFRVQHFDESDREIRNLTVFWNYGDGHNMRAGEFSSHTYGNAGQYLLTGTFTYKHEEYIVREIIKIIESNITINFIDGILSIQNNHNFEINVSGWKVLFDNTIFTFPKGSFILSNNETPININTGESDSYELQLANGTTIYKTPEPIPTPPKDLVKPNIKQNVVTKQISEIPSKINKEHIEEKEMDNVITQNIVENNNEIAINKGIQTKLWFWLIILLLLVILSTVPLFFTKK